MPCGRWYNRCLGIDVFTVAVGPAVIMMFMRTPASDISLTDFISVMCAFGYIITKVCI